MVVLVAALALLGGCKSDEQKLLDDAMGLHEEVYKVLESNVETPKTALTELEELEGKTRESRAKLANDLVAAMSKLTDDERKEFDEEALRRYRQLATKFGTIVKRYPTEVQPKLIRLISTITSERPKGG